MATDIAADIAEVEPPSGSSWARPGSRRCPPSSRRSTNNQPAGQDRVHRQRQPLARQDHRCDRRQLARTDTFLSDRYHRLARRRGKRAIVAVGNSVLTIIWHLLSDADTRYRDLHPSYHDAKINQQRRPRELTRQLP